MYEVRNLTSREKSQRQDREVRHNDTIAFNSSIDSSHILDGVMSHESTPFKGREFLSTVKKGAI